jgi:peroxiredoxin Q/BCP
LLPLARKTRSLPEAGDRAPAFCLPDDRGRPHSLKDYRGRWVILYFYPRDLTPGCTREACDFRDAYRSLRRRQATVLGISTDSAESHRKFRSQHELPFPLLVDALAHVARLFGVWRRKVNYGRRYMGIERSTFVIDPSGRIAAAMRGVKVDGHVEEVKERIASYAGR